MASMYEQLLNLPLFKGVSFEKISEIVGLTKFHFTKYEEGHIIAREGEPCTHIMFILSGAAQMVISTPNERFRIAQKLSAPEVISPDYLFGRATRYPGTVTALEPTGILQITKADYIRILHLDEVFLFNFLNLLSRDAQQSLDGLLAVTTGSIAQRIAYWIVTLTQPEATDITLSCRHRDLYAMFGWQRVPFYAALDEMVEAGLITYSQNEIKIMSRTRLKELLLND